CTQNQRQPLAVTSLKTNGTQTNCTLNTRMNSKPVKNVGSEKPTNASVLEIWSKIEYALRAASTPTGMAISNASSCAEPMTNRVAGRRCRISVSTSMRLANE